MKVGVGSQRPPAEARVNPLAAVLEAGTKAQDGGWWKALVGLREMTASQSCSSVPVF